MLTSYYHTCHVPAPVTVAPTSGVVGSGRGAVPRAAGPTCPPAAGVGRGGGGEGGGGPPMVNNIVPDKGKYATCWVSNRRRSIQKIDFDMIHKWVSNEN